MNITHKRGVKIINKDFLVIDPLPNGWVNKITEEELCKYYSKTKVQTLLESIEKGGTIDISWVETHTDLLNLMAAIRKNELSCLSWP